MLDNARSWLAWKMAPAEVKQLAGADASGLVQALLGDSSRLSSTPRGMPEVLDAYNKMPWLRAVVHKVGSSIGMTTWQLFVARNANTQRSMKITKFQYGDRRIRHRLMKQAGPDVEMEEILEHPLLNLLNGGSELLPGTSNMKMAQIYFDLVGEILMLKERGDINNPTTGKRVVKRLAVLPPTWLKRLPTPDEPTYGIQFGRTGIVDDVPVEDIIYCRDPNPANPYGRGSGLASVLGDELQADDAAARTIRYRLENNAIPPFIAMPEDKATAPDRKQLDRVREDWQRRLRGPSKSGFVHFLLNRFKFEKLGNTFEELQLVPLRAAQRDMIIQVYGLPPEIFGIISNSNRATIDAAEFLFGMFALLPRLEFHRSVLQQLLVPEFDDRLILDYESPVSEDKDYELSVMKAAPWAFKANEYRRRAGEESLGDEGEVFGVPTSVFVEPSLSGMSVNDEPDDSGGTETFDLPLAVSPQVEETIRELAGKAGREAARIVKQDEDDIADAADDEILRKNTEPVVKDAVIKAGIRRLEQLVSGIAFDIGDPYVARILAEFAGQQIKRINRTTLLALRATLREGFEAGEDINMLARRVRSVFRTARGHRSLLIARTESVRALNAGQLAATRQAGFEAKEWLATRDSKVRDTHVGLDGDVVAVNANFVSSSGAQGPHPGALGTAAEDCNCRCALLSVSKMPKNQDIRFPSGFDTEEKREQEWKANERERAPVERQLRGAFRRAFEQQEQEVLRRLRSRL